MKKIRFLLSVVVFVSAVGSLSASSQKQMVQQLTQYSEEIKLLENNILELDKRYMDVVTRMSDKDDGLLEESEKIDELRKSKANELENKRSSFESLLAQYRERRAKIKAIDEKITLAKEEVKKAYAGGVILDRSIEADVRGKLFDLMREREDLVQGL